jgi:UPF0755 protein
MVDDELFVPIGTSSKRVSQSRFKWRRFFVISTLMVVFGAVIGLYILQTLAQPPQNFPVGSPIEITPGSGVKEIATQMVTAGVVKSEILLYLAIILYHDPTTIKASTYVFEKPETVYEIARLLTVGDFDSDLIEFTHREGESNEDVANRAAATLTDFDAATFLKIAEGSEGKMFPETYWIPADFSEAALYDKMRATYEETVGPLRPKITESGLSESDVITLASIIEREANSPESMRLVAGILRNRLDEGMYLQVDASIEYALHKPLSELTPEDLTSDSPYNTYTNPGLPPTPIGNPGLVSIMAVLAPEASPYFFYITDESGTFHYAKTFDEHKINIARYLR